MDYLENCKNKVIDLYLWYRKYLYYYHGYLRHELRLHGYSLFNTSLKLEAVKANDIDTIKEHVFKGLWRVDDLVSVNNCTTMLHEAVVLDRREIFSFLIREGANPNTRDRNGMTPMLKAAALGREKIVIELLKIGVNPNHRDPYGNTPYDKAVLHEEWSTANVLSSAKSYTSSPTEWIWPSDV